MNTISGSMSNRLWRVQADTEPICIDSDEDEHAPGTVPAREGNQNGAGPALRRSERSNITKTTVQMFQGSNTIFTALTLSLQGCLTWTPGMQC